MQSDSVIERLLQILPLPLKPRNVVIGHLEGALVLELIYIGVAPRIQRHIPRADPVHKILKRFGEKRLIGNQLLRYARQLGYVLGYLAVLRTNVTLEFGNLLIIFVELDCANLYDFVRRVAANVFEGFADGIHFQINYDVNQKFCPPQKKFVLANSGCVGNYPAAEKFLACRATRDVSIKIHMMIYFRCLNSQVKQYTSCGVLSRLANSLPRCRMFG